jgi:nicotinate-nucleotide adenylyltransferase
MKIGVFGGTFDPPHTGHMILAECAMSDLALDSIVFVPAYRSPFKTGQQSLPADIRTEMLALAISENPRFHVETFEISNSHVSYSVDTLRYLSSRHPDDELYLIMGADTFNDFNHWRDPDEIAHLATLCVGCRYGTELDLDGSPYKDQVKLFSMPGIQISSTDIRRRVACGLSIRYLVPWAVNVFIDTNKLYR